MGPAMRYPRLVGMSSTTSFGPYELLRRLGSGGMAETFLALRRGPGAFEQRVCVKRILPALESDPELVRLFMEEARLAAQLRHANITQVVDFGVVDGSHYLALELVEGTDLRTLLASLRARGQRLAPAIAIYIATGLTAALEFAHTPEPDRHPVIHRDVSPSNILLSRAGEVYLTDFGVARALGGVERMTQSGVVRGKVPYMAPEYALTGKLDPRSDLFAVGVVLYEALAGRRPFDGQTELDTLNRIREGRHRPLAELCPEAPSQLVAIVEQLLVPDPNERFQTASALLQALAYIAPPPTVARELAQLVRTVEPPKEDAYDPALAGPTVPMLNRPAAPRYPAVEPAPSDVETRTQAPALSSTPTPDPERGLWSATDPEKISLDHGSPAIAIASVKEAPAPSIVPTTRIQPPERTGIRARWIVLSLALGLVVFAASVVAGFTLVRVLGIAP